MNNFSRRTLTGAWIVIFIMGGFWLHPLTFILTGLVMLIGAQFEYYRMIKISGVRPQVVAGMAAGIITYLIAVIVASGVAKPNLFLILIPVLILITLMELYRKNEKPFDSLAHTFFALIYIVLPFSIIPFSGFFKSGLNSLLPHDTMVFSPGIVIGFFILMWANDSGAYLAGITMGKHRLMERISPKKSWEGFFGGVITAALAGWLLSGWLGVISKGEWIIVALIVSVAGTYGDLTESMLKRSIGVKDSGNIMPGHGGFLDRFDSTIISFPLVYLFISLFG